jgi:nardilysin
MRSLDLTPTRSLSDRKNYRLLQFESGFECLLISSAYLLSQHATNSGEAAPELKAAAAMSVQVGSFADPLECEGLAHFLEHMVFMGSEKYPKENEYDVFVSSHGGSCNAQTEGEYTAYQFDVSAEYFSQTLDIFANCFLCPILSVSSSDRELKAIENEFQLAKTNDGARLQQLFCSFATDQHIFKKFSWGSIDSLQTKPSSLNIPVQDYLRAFHALHYVPANCRLVVLGPVELDELQTHVLASFASWCDGPHDSIHTNDNANSRTTKSRLSDSDSAAIHVDTRCDDSASSTLRLLTLTESCAPYVNKPFLKPELHTMLARIVPLETTHLVSLCWQLPATYQNYRGKHTRYLSHLIGHEGSGSLLSSLKQDLWAELLTAGVSSGHDVYIVYVI